MRSFSALRALCAAIWLLQACIAVRVASAAPAEDQAQWSTLGCGLLSASAVVSPGCPCTPESNAAWAACPAGYVCAQPWRDGSALGAVGSEVAGAAQQFASQLAGRASTTLQQLGLPGFSASTTLQQLGLPSFPAGSAAAAFFGGTGAVNKRALLAAGGAAEKEAAPAAPEPQLPPSFVCQPCAYGQFCPQGSALPAAGSPSFQMALQRLQCPAGMFCPTPAEARSCPEGAFCAQGSVEAVTCDMGVLLAQYPTLATPERAPSIFERVFMLGDVLAGNSCPANSTKPASKCAEGHFCPQPGLSFPCPAGWYCPAGSLQPKPCPRFMHYCPEGSAKAKLHGLGFIILGLCGKALLMLWALQRLLTRVNQKRMMRTQEARERLWRLLTPLFTPRPEHRRPSFHAFKPVRPKIILQFDNLGLKLHDGTPILSGVTGRFRHSRVAAVMGPSGAGKSTFLAVLMGRGAHYGEATGTVRVNGWEMELGQLQAITGFVPQDDIVHEDLTVHENLAYSARLRLSHSKPRREQLAVVEEVLAMLQLRHVQHQVVGSAERRGISGGQRKRVNIGWELVACPSILLLDEPSSGLDASAAVDIIESLKQMASLGMNVACVIHQPRWSIFRLFDDVLLLGNGGRMVYLGPSHLALPYFESLGFALPPLENPADFCLDLISGSVPRSGSASFQPNDLIGLWQTYGLSWVRTQRKLVPAEPQPLAPANAPRLDPQQLQLLEQAFDAADFDGDGAISGNELRELLRGLGLQPTQRDVQTIMRELAAPRAGSRACIAKDTFMQYVRYGGRPPAPDAAASPGQHRADSVYRVYSIEHYTLANVLSELSCAALPAGLVEGATLKEVAAAAMAAGEAQQGGLGAVHHPSRVGTGVQQDATSRLEGGSEAVAANAGPSSSVAGVAPAPTLSALRLVPALSVASSVERRRTDSGRTDRSETPVSVRIPPDAVASPFSSHPAADGGQPQEEGSSPLASPHSPGAPVSGAGSKQPLPLSPVQLPASDSSGADSQQAAEGEQGEHGSAMGQEQLLPAGSALSSAGSSRGRSGSYRSTPGAWGQFWTLLARAATKWVRGWGSKFTDLLLLVFAGVVIGALHASDDSNLWALRRYTALVMLTLGMLSTVSSFSVFGKDRVVFWREQASGIRTWPYFLANSAVNLVDVAVQPLIFLGIYHSLMLPAIPFVQFYAVGVAVAWYCSSLGALFSVLISPSNALVAAVTVVMVLGGFLNGVSPNYRDMSEGLKRVAGASFNRWAIQTVAILDFQALPRHMWPVTRAVMTNAGYCGLDQLEPPSKDEDRTWQLQGTEAELDVSAYCAGQAAWGLAAVALEGLLLRLLTYLALRLCARGLSLEGAVAALARRTRRGLRRRPAT